MARTSFNRMVTFGVLNFMGTDNATFEDIGLEVVRWTDSDGKEIPDPRVNLCARVAPELAFEVDSICAFLSVSKRRFIEAAIIEAIRQTKEVMREEGMFEHVKQHNDSNKDAD